MEAVAAFLKKAQSDGLLRRLTPIAGRQNGKISFADGEFIDFSSNDYLGLAQHPRLVRAFQEAALRFGTGASASRLLTGDFEMHHRLEEEIARFKGKESALVFNSGYQANTGIISALYGKGDVIFSDRLNHASIVDGIRLSGAAHLRFKHNDLDHLGHFLDKDRAKYKKALIVTETVFSMDGDRPRLKELVSLKERYDCQLMVDEAHATGIFGPKGSGMAEAEGVSDRVDLVMGTFSKALGGFGAYLAASKDSTDYLINTCRSFIYSTALPPAVIAGDLESLRLVEDQPRRRQDLLEQAEFFREGLRGVGFRIKGDTQIVPLVVGDNFKAVECANELRARGFWVSAIRPPTVPAGQARLRFSLTAYHDRGILQRLLDAIKRLGL